MHEIKGLNLTYIFKYECENLVARNIMNRIVLLLRNTLILIKYRMVIDYILIKTSDLFLMFNSNLRTPLPKGMERHITSYQRFIYFLSKINHQ